MIRDTLPCTTPGRHRQAVSPLGLGTNQVRPRPGVKYPSGFTIPMTAKPDLLARDLGINLIDTAHSATARTPQAALLRASGELG